MPRWVIIFSVVAIVAGIFGLTGNSEGDADIATIVLFLFLALIVLALIFGGAIWKNVS